MAKSSGIEIRWSSAQAKKLDAIAESLRDIRAEVERLTRVIGDAALLLSQQRDAKKKKAKEPGFGPESSASTDAQTSVGR